MFTRAVSDAVGEERAQVSILGRTHSSMLGHGDTKAGNDSGPWLYESLRKALLSKSDAPKVLVLLPNTFSNEQTEYDQEIIRIAERHHKLPLSQRPGPDVMDMRAMTRTTVTTLIDLKMRVRAGENDFRVLLINEAPRACLIMTSRFCFYEMYVPGLDGGVEDIRQAARIDAAGHESQSYAAMADYFESLRARPDTQDAIGVLAQYCAEHAGTLENRYSRQVRAQLVKYEQLYERKVLSA